MNAEGSTNDQWCIEPTNRTSNMPRQCGYTARIATMIAITALYVSPALALTPQPQSPPKGPPQGSQQLYFHPVQYTTCTRECGYPTGLYQVCRDNSGRTVSKTLITLNACMR
jgi:hypothetical protein